MERKDTGLRVVETAWKYRVPAFVCSGGYRHRNNSVLRIAPTISGLSLENMGKDNPETWYKILEGIDCDATKEEGSLLKSILRLRKAGYGQVPDEVSGKMARKIVENYLQPK